jgi:putative DNA primase/helicase
VAPTREQAVAALAELKGLIATFPFIDEPSRAVALSAILTSVIRPSIPTVPLHGFTAPTAGSGKSLLVDIASVISAGREAAVVAQGKTEEEMEKRLGAALIAGDGIISIDNCQHSLDGELLCQVLTQPILKIRILGKSVLSEVPSNAVIFATGNNLSAIGDMTRRTILCSLDPNCERPELREFKTHPLDMIRQHRAFYVLAALTVLRAFHVAGRPRQKAAPLGSFEVWSGWVRDALVWCGETDPVATMERAREDDPKLEALSNVVHQWETVIGEQRVSTSDVIDAATMTSSGGFDPNAKKFVNAEFREALLVVAGDGGAINSRRLGKWLASIKGRIVNGKRIVADGTVAGVAQWQLEWKI